MPKPTYLIDGIALDDPAGRWRLDGDTGRRALPAVRSTAATIPGRHGETYTPGDPFDPTTLGLSLLVTDRNNAGQPTGPAQAERNLEALTAIFYGKAGLHEITHRIGTQERANHARLDATAQPVALNGRLTRYTLPIILRFPNPFWTDKNGPVITEHPAPAQDNAIDLPALTGGSAPITDAIVRLKGPFNGIARIADGNDVGTTYAWTGTPNNSHSTKTDNRGATTNLVRDPRPTSSSSGVPDYGNCQRSIDSVDGEPAIRVYLQGASGLPWLRFSDHLPPPNIGDTIRLQIQIKAVHPTAAETMRLLVFRSNGFGVAEHELAQPVPLNEWVTLTHETTVTAAPAYSSFSARISPNGAVVQDGSDYFYFRRALVQAGDPTTFSDTYFDGDTPNTPPANENPTGLTWQGNLPADTYLYLNADNLTAHTATTPTAWNTGDDATSGLDYPPAGPLQLTPTPDITQPTYGLRYHRPAALNTPDALAVYAGRRFL